MKEINYGTMPIRKLISKLAIPNIITMIAGSINIIIDGIFVGNYIGSSALAAVNLVMPILIISFVLIDTIAIGASIRCGILLGEGKRIKASKIFSSTMVLMVVISIFISILSFVFAKDIIYFFIEDEILATLAYDYTKAFIPTILLIAPLYVLDNFLYLCGLAKKSMYINIFVVILNIFLNIIFIGYLELGIFYIALSTVIASFVGSTLMLLPFLSRKLALKFLKPKLYFEDFKMIIYNGSSEFFKNISGSLMIILANAIMLSLAGANGVAALSIILYIEMLILPILGGVISTVQPIVSYNYGAKNYKRVDETFKIICCISGVLSIIILLFIVVFRDFLVSLFIEDGNIEVAKIATLGLLLYTPSFLFTWFNIVVATFLTSFEKPTASIVLMLLDTTILPVIFFLLLSQLIGVQGMFLAQSISSFFTFLVALYIYKTIFVKKI